MSIAGLTGQHSKPISSSTRVSAARRSLKVSPRAHVNRKKRMNKTFTPLPLFSCLVDNNNATFGSRALIYITFDSSKFLIPHKSKVSQRSIMKEIRFKMPSANQWRSKCKAQRRNYTKETSHHATL